MRTLTSSIKDNISFEFVDEGKVALAYPNGDGIQALFLVLERGGYEPEYPSNEEWMDELHGYIKVNRYIPESETDTLRERFEYFYNLLS